MDNFLDFLYVFLSFAVGTFYAGKAMRYCINHKLYDHVNHRSSHKTPTPRGGGFAFVLIISIFALIWLNIGSSITGLAYFNTLFLAGAFIAYLGWLDDNHNIHPFLRLLCQFASTGLCAWVLPPVFVDSLPLWVEKTLIIFAWVWFINLYNFMDGIDGLAVAQTAFIAFVLSIIMPSVKPIALVILGSVLGFLRFNWHPARVFMGDVGSTYLGFILAGFLIYNTQVNPVSGIWVALCVSAIFVVDATYTLIKRTLKGQKPWQAHKDHFYQRAVLLGMSHAAVVRRVIGLNLIFAFAAIVTQYSYLGPLLFASILFILLGVALRIRYLEGRS